MHKYNILFLVCFLIPFIGSETDQLHCHYEPFGNKCEIWL